MTPNFGYTPRKSYLPYLTRWRVLRWQRIMIYLTRQQLNLPINGHYNLCSRLKWKRRAFLFVILDPSYFRRWAPARRGPS